MDEVIAKSKFHKARLSLPFLSSGSLTSLPMQAERQKMKSADDETRLELDAELKDLRGILAGGAVSRGDASGTALGSRTKAAETTADDAEEDEEESEEDDEEVDDDEEEDGAESDGSGSTYELNDEELEAALAASTAKSGVDRDLLRKLIGSAADRSPSPSPPPAASTSASPAIQGGRPPPAKPAADDDDDDDSKDPYDIYVRELALEPRAHATNRLKTPLELAQEAAEQLKKQEERRLKRQRGEEDLSSDEEDGVDGKRKKKEKKRAPQGDDLDDDYLEEQYGSDVDASAAPAVAVGELGQDLETEGVLLEGDDESAEGSEGDDEESSDDGAEEENEDDDDEMDVGDLDAADSEDEAVEGETEALVAPSTAKFDKSGELPYTFPCPSSHAEFAKLLRSSGIKDEDTITVVKRIRTLYHPGLAESNKEKLQVFANVLLDHVVYLCSSPSPSTFATVNSLLPQLLTMSHAYPLTCAPHYVTKLSLMHRNLLRGLIRGPLDPSAKTWPGLPEVTLLRLIGMVWSTSDLSHPVAAPALLLIGEYLSQARVRSLSDIASGIFLVSLVAQFEEQSKRIVPEAINFLANALALLFPTSSAVSATSFPGFFPTPDIGQDHVKSLKLGRESSSVEPPKSVNLLEALAAKGKNGKGKGTVAEAAQLKVDLAASALRLVETCRAMYSESEAFIEMFKPIESILKAVKVDKLSASLKVRAPPPMRCSDPS